MDKVNEERKKKGLAPQEPWELFDLIGGTSTGGYVVLYLYFLRSLMSYRLIAVMLGRLRMSVKECKERYMKLAKDAFTPIYSSFNRVGKLLGKIQAKPAFNEKKLEDAILSIILSALQRDVKTQLRGTSRHMPEMPDRNKGSEAQNLLLYHPGQSEQSGKTYAIVQDNPLFKIANTNQNISFVVAADESNAQAALILRSYNNPHGSRDPIDHCLLWQACRATSAAPTFFAPLAFEDPETGKQRRLIDGGIVNNNPVSLVYRESQDLWPNTTPLLISIGTGLKEDTQFKGAALSIAKSLVEIATETEATHQRFKNGSGKELANKNKYFRFNVPNLGTIGMEEYKKLADLQKETIDYISEHSGRALAEACVEKMLETATPGT
ncbi:ankyrin repeat protein [Rutstroemia sp. NJR-2017a WRK4]|nr:ankyrin repeat protein [Rutstroemia sp. NJR-2017a WRK4]